MWYKYPTTIQHPLLLILSLPFRHIYCRWLRVQSQCYWLLSQCLESLYSCTYPKNLPPLLPLPLTSIDQSPFSLFSQSFLRNILLKFSGLHVTHLLSRNLIPPNQFGFVPHRSTSDALISACHQVSSALDAQPSSCAVFIDLKKAFDSVSHAAHLLEKLYSLDLPSFLFSWFKSCLTGRSQHVHIGTSLSNSLPILSSIPQGSILSPLSFSMTLLRSLPLSPSTKLFIYADDVLLLHPANCPADIAFLNLELQTISLWLSQKSLHNIMSQSLNTCFFFLSSSVYTFNNLPSVSISGSCLERVHSYKYLGVLLNHNLILDTSHKLSPL